MKNYSDYLKNKGVQSYTSIPMIPSAFMYLDYANGKKHVVYDDNEKPIEEYKSIGNLIAGLTIITGKSTTGKTTLAAAFAQSIVHPYVHDPLLRTIVENSVDSMPVIEVYDAEMKFDISMIKRVTQYSNKLLQKIVTVHRKKKDKEITELIDKHIEYKVKNMEKIKYRFKDMYGDNYHHYPPTVIILDSVNQIDSFNVKSYEDMVGNTTGLLRAKAIQNIYNYMSEKAAEYNIHFICIQHILLDAQLAFIPKPKQYRGLKKDEKFVAGEKSILLSTNIYRLEHVKEIGTAKPTYLNLGEGVEGFVAKCSIIKSSTNVMGRSFHLLNLKESGYNRVLSTFYEATLRGDVEKSGNGYIIDGYDKKVTVKKFLEIAQEDFTIVNKLYKHLDKKLDYLLSSSEYSSSKVDKEVKGKKTVTEEEEIDMLNQLLFNADDFED